MVTGEDDPLAARSNTKQEALNKAIEQGAQAYIAGDLLAAIAETVAPICRCTVAADDPHTLNVMYPAAFSDAYLRPEVRLEIGPLAAWLPYDRYPIRPYAAEVFPQFFAQAEATVQTIRAERTFWEKATILHQEAHRPEDKPQPLRYSRHYYDLAMMATTPIKDKALADLALLEEVAAFKQRFYPRGWARYELATPGTLKLVPGDDMLIALKKDYAQMRTMIFGRYPSFDEVMETLRMLEIEINALR